MRAAKSIVVLWLALFCAAAAAQTQVLPDFTRLVDEQGNAVVNVSKPSNFDTTDYTASAGNVYPSIQSYTTARMGGVDRIITGYRVAVYACDSVGLAHTPPAVTRQGSAGRVLSCASTAPC